MVIVGGMSRSSSVSSELGRLSVTPAPFIDNDFLDFEDDVSLLAQYPENYKELISNVQLQNGLSTGNIQKLNGIQGVFLRYCLRKRDIFGLLPAKTGKTAIFVLATLQLLDLQESVASTRAPLVVVLAPTRELADQIFQTYLLLGKWMPQLNVRLFIGGIHNTREDIQGLLTSKRRIHVVVATPGRLRELVNGHFLHMNAVKHFVFDEADRILGDEEMRRDAQFIFMKTGVDKQTMVFGSTFSGVSKDICLRYLRNPFAWSGPPVDNPRHDGVINHRFYHSHENNKMDYLKGFLDLVLEREPQRQVLIFVDTRDRCKDLLEYLTSKEMGFDAIQIQGGLQQHYRFYCFSLAKENKKKLIVTTDLCARGLDIPLVSVVVNYDCPKGFSGNQNGGRHDPVEARDTYYHRTNRCGRDVEQSLVLTLARDAEDINFLRTEVEQTLGYEMIELLKD